MYCIVNLFAVNLNTGGGLDADPRLPRPQLDQPHDDLLRACGDYDVLEFASAQNQHCSNPPKKNPHNESFVADLRLPHRSPLARITRCLAYGVWVS
jgi:hypothetical protein